MYLVIFDKFIINGEIKENYICLNNYYKAACDNFMDLKNLEAGDVDEILIYSRASIDATKYCYTAKCTRIEHLDNGIRIFLSELKEAEVTCEQVLKRTYAFLKRTGIADNSDNLRFLSLYVITDANDYARFKGDKKESQFMSVMQKIEAYQKEAKWNEIIKLFPNFEEIEKSPYWDDEKCLSSLAFAISMVNNRKKSVYYERFFLKFIDHCIEISTYNTSYKSMKAYYFYNKYIGNPTENDYDIAVELYKELVTISKEKYKELYRYTKLLETHFDSIKWTGEFRDTLRTMIADILAHYEELIDEYNNLSEDKQKSYKRYYIRVLYGYASFSIDNILKYWDRYFDNKVFGSPIGTKYLSQKKFDVMSKVTDCLEKICSLLNYDYINIDLVKEKPSYFDVNYRLAQIKQIQGIYYVMQGKSESEYKKLFEKSNEIVKKILDTANNYRNNQNARINYPHFVKLISAINYYFLGNEQECHACFYNARTYMKFEEARIYVLQNKLDDAIRILNSIPSKDNCYNKSQQLLQKIVK